MLFTPDLSATQEFPQIFLASQSGNTGAHLTKEGWQLYRIKPDVRLIRDGAGSLRSISDEVVVFQDGKLMRVESLQGELSGLFLSSLKPGATPSPIP